MTQTVQPAPEQGFEFEVEWKHCSPFSLQKLGNSYSNSYYHRIMSNSGGNYSLMTHDTRDSSNSFWELLTGFGIVLPHITLCRHWYRIGLAKQSESEAADKREVAGCGETAAGTQIHKLLMPDETSRV